MRRRATSLILKGHKGGILGTENYLELNFTPGERKTALAIAKEWEAKGQKPLLYSKDWEGPIQVLYRWNEARVRKVRMAA